MATQALISILYNSCFVVDPNSYTMFVALLNIKTSYESLNKIFCRGKKITKSFAVLNGRMTGKAAVAHARQRFT